MTLFQHHMFYLCREGDG